MGAPLPYSLRLSSSASQLHTSTGRHRSHCLPHQQYQHEKVSLLTGTVAMEWRLWLSLLVSSVHGSSPVPL